MDKAENPAELASRRALEAMYSCLVAGKSFRLEAGAGAGKTYSLVKALQYLIERNKNILPKHQQQIACITFTNVAKEEIIARTDRSPLVFCETNHAFCWSLIGGFQKPLRSLVEAMPAWQEKLAEFGGSVGARSVEYSLGYRSVREDRITLHHNDVLPLTIELMKEEKFRTLMVSRFPIILVDEYQDTDKAWVEAIKANFLGQAGSPLFGFFGDHWQKIYEGGCGKLEHEGIVEIGKEANFRSVQAIVECLNRMRPELRQFVEDPTAPGEVRVFHTNDWGGERQRGSHWAGDLPTDVAHATLDALKSKLQADRWNLEPDHTKILMLTHRLLATEQGYARIASTFRFNEAFTKKEHPHIAFLVDQLEPACDAFASRKFGKMFEVLGGSTPHIKSHTDKESWHDAMTELVSLRDRGTVGEVIEHLSKTRRPRLPDPVEKMERELKGFNKEAGTEMPEALGELEQLRSVPYAEIKALRRYLDGHSPFETKHGVKGAEFENVIVVIGRGWNRYNFGEMLELASATPIPASKQDAFERNRNLFYVVCSRPKRRLALLFTQKLSPEALSTLAQWFGSGALHAAPT